MQTALTQLIEQLRISGNIHGAMEAEKFLPIEKTHLIDMYMEAAPLWVSSDEALELAMEFFNETFNNNQ